MEIIVQHTIQFFTFFYQYTEQFYELVDFFIPKAKRAVQAAFSIADSQTLDREINALLKLAEHYNLKRLEIVTFDEERIIKRGKKTINIIPVWKFALRYF